MKRTTITMANTDAVEAARSYLLTAESVNQKAQLVGDIAEQTERKQTLQAELATVDRALTKAYEAAIKGGWSSTELAELGYTAQRKARKPRKPREAKTTVSDTPLTTTTPTHEVRYE